MVPAMIYLLGMPTSLAIGTSLFQIIFVTANVTFLQALTVQTVDILLAVLLLTGAVIGAQFGSKYSVRMKGEQLRALLALLVLGVCVKMIFDLTVMPADLYSIALLMGLLLPDEQTNFHKIQYSSYYVIFIGPTCLWDRVNNRFIDERSKS